MSLAYKKLSPRAQREADLQRMVAGGTPRHSKQMLKLVKSTAILFAKKRGKQFKITSTKEDVLLTFLSRNGMGGRLMSRIAEHAVAQPSLSARLFAIEKKMIDAGEKPLSPEETSEAIQTFSEKVKRSLAVAGPRAKKMGWGI